MISSQLGDAKRSRSLQVGGEQSRTESHCAAEMLTCLSHSHLFITNVEEGGAGGAGRKRLGNVNSIISFATLRWNCMSFKRDVRIILDLKAACRHCWTGNTAAFAWNQTVNVFFPMSSAYLKMMQHASQSERES